LFSGKKGQQGTVGKRYHRVGYAHSATEKAEIDGVSSAKEVDRQREKNWKGKTKK